jgi:hypothetical protein
MTPPVIAAEATVPGILNDSAAPQQPELLSVIGNPSVVRISRFTWLGAPSDPECTSFEIQVRNPFLTAEIWTLGLGHTTLAAWPADGSTGHQAATSLVSCDVGAAWQSRLRLPLGNSLRWRIGVRLDTKSLSADGTTIEGQVLISTDRRGALSIPLKVERLPMSPFVTALAWFVGIVVPAGLGYWLTRLSEARIDHNKRVAERVATEQKQQEEFVAWRQVPSSVTLMDEFFDQQLPAAAGLPHPCVILFSWMHSAGMLAKVPPLDFETLATICQTDDRQSLLDHLRKLFPERANQLPNALP